VQPATSPIWDTSWTIIALHESGVDKNNECLKKAAAWLLEKQVKIYGDWKIKNPEIKTGCWSFEFNNNFYPDVDDTAVVCCALNFVNLGNNHLKNQAIKEGIDWVLNMQNNDGSWAAFDKNNYKKLLKHIPYADFITPLDFGSPDITAHVLYVLGQLEYNFNSKILKNALNYLVKSQQNDGSWYGRWGVNYIYGTSKVLQSFDCLKKMPNLVLNQPLLEKITEKAVLWFQNCQNSDGGWSESCSSYEAKKYIGLNESTPSQTAWAITGLLTFNKVNSKNNELDSTIIDKGVDYLLNTQNADGSWKEEYFTGGGFPRAFYLKYEMYKDYFPLIALTKYKKLIGKNKL